jgi:hypothetical protein
MMSVSYQREAGDYFFPEFLVIGIIIIIIIIVIILMRLSPTPAWNKFGL